MARSTMSSLIQHLRELTNMGTAEYTVGATTYWTDDQLQSVLDQNRTDIKEFRMTPIPETVGAGEVDYYDYIIPESLRWLEQGTTVTFILNQTYGTLTAGTSTNNYAIDYDRHVVTFVGDQEAQTRYLRARSYDMHGAAADVWGKVEAYYTHQVDWSSDNHSVKASQKAAQARRAKQREESLSRRGGDTRMVRLDESAWPG